MVKTKKPLDGGPNGRTSADTIAAEIGALTFQMTRWQRPNESLSLLFLLRLLLTLGQRCGELGVGGTKGSIKASPSPTATLAPRACTSSSGATHAAVGD